ncbi:hypothetical protein NQ317_018115 [Molorchus minor]|uniref:Neurotransmitter-gated ion-channel transmembrane domain-containing protein n=1 Tax=Molorchus minor TaxID=1323400 RepID=A0ABQ9JD67_9CUCU|nr:hypothetical protein NQ317_018115 [Molorchus minor]
MDLSRAKRIIKLALKKQDVSISNNSEDNSNNLLNEALLHDVVILIIAEYSMLLVSFHLQRHMGNFLIQVYGPCVLLVVLSWVSFWLNREATADRVSLGITTVLTMTFLGLEARTDLPKVPYPTALDFFVFLSFSFIFATIIQFAVVHYFTKYGSGECYFSTEYSSESSSEDEDWMSIETKEFLHVTPTVSEPNTRTPTASPCPNGREPQYLEVIPLSACSIPMPQKKAIPAVDQSESQSSYISPKTNNATHRITCQNHNQHRKKKKRAPRFNSVSKIDRASRIVFSRTFYYH